MTKYCAFFLAIIFDQFNLILFGLCPLKTIQLETVVKCPNKTQPVDLLYNSKSVWQIANVTYGVNCLQQNFRYITEVLHLHRNYPIKYREMPLCRIHN